MTQYPAETHVARANELLNESRNLSVPEDEAAILFITAAQVHATLALVDTLRAWRERVTQ